MKYNNTKNIENVKASKYFMKADIIVVVILIIMLVGVLVLAFQPQGEEVKIYIDGKLKYTYSLNGEKQVINLNVNGEENANTIVIEDGYVYMKDATCKNKICVNNGKIHRVGETICCAPHKVVVEITGKNREVDTVA